MKPSRHLAASIWISEFGGHALNTIIWLQAFTIISKIQFQSGNAVQLISSIDQVMALTFLGFLIPLSFGHWIGRAAIRKLTKINLNPPIDHTNGQTRIGTQPKSPQRILVLSEAFNLSAILAILILTTWVSTFKSEGQSLLLVLVAVRALIAFSAGIHQQVRDLIIEPIKNISLLHLCAPIFTVAVFAVCPTAIAATKTILLINAFTYLWSITTLSRQTSLYLGTLPSTAMPDRGPVSTEMLPETSVSRFPPSTRSPISHLFWMTFLGGWTFALFFVHLLSLSLERRFLPTHWTFALAMTLYSLGIFLGLRLGDRRVQVWTRRWFESILSTTIVAAIAYGIFLFSQLYVGKVEHFLVSTFIWATLLSFIGLGRMRYLAKDLSLDLQSLLSQKITLFATAGILVGTILQSALPRTLSIVALGASVVISPCIVLFESLRKQNVHNLNREPRQSKELR